MGHKMKMIKALGWIGCLVFLSMAGCSKDAEVLTCNPGTLLLHFTCDADLGQVTGEAVLEGLSGQTATRAITLTCPGSFNLEASISGYERDAKVRVTVSATADQTVLAQNLNVPVSLLEGCTKIDVKLEKPASNNPDAPVIVQDGDGGITGPDDASTVTPQPDADPTATGLSRGEPCARDDQCTDGHCADGVCCDNACDGVCMACTTEKTGNPTGQCTLAKAGVKHDKCETKDPKTCGTNGTCNGAGQCAFFDNTNECVAAACNGGNYVPAQKCSGAGACQPASPSQCGEYACTPQGCKMSCDSSADCSAGVQCINKKCGGKRALGEVCGANSECTSPGFCVDGVCCGSRCDGVCEACSTAMTGGNNGECAAVPANKGSQADCMVQSAASCGTTGRCDGARQCEYHAAGTECAGQLCSGTTQTGARKCDGAGSCLAALTTDCVPGKCDAATKQCKQGCTADGDCATGAYCDGSTCKAKKAAAATCGRAGECGSNFCADGKCCNQACNGNCLECSTGTCKAVTNAEDPGTCSGTKSCTSAGLCLSKDGEPCSGGSECASGTCSTYHRDADNDTFGVDVAEKFCGAGARPGYVARGGDCCDIDQVSHPFSFVTTTMTLGPYDQPVKNACGSWDWDCNGNVWKMKPCMANVCKDCNSVTCTDEEYGFQQSCGVYWLFGTVPECGETARACLGCTSSGLRDCNDNFGQTCR